MTFAVYAMWMPSLCLPANEGELFVLQLHFPFTQRHKNIKTKTNKNNVRDDNCNLSEEKKGHEKPNRKRLRDGSTNRKKEKENKRGRNSDQNTIESIYVILLIKQFSVQPRNKDF